jgi:hypothetical protein
VVHRAPAERGQVPPLKEAGGGGLTPQPPKGPRLAMATQRYDVFLPRIAFAASNFNKA